MKKVFFIPILLMILAGCTPNYNLKAQKSALGAVQLVDGSIQLENPKIKLVISPQFGGRVVSLHDKSTSEEIFQPVDPKNPERGGGFNDIVDLKWPGEADFAYKVKELKLSKTEDEIHLTLSHISGMGDPKAKKLEIIKTYTLNNFSANVQVDIKVKNISGKAVKFTYWNQSRPIFGKAETNARMTWIRLKGDVTNLGFVPLAGAKDGVEMKPQNGFVAITAKDSKLAAIFSFDPEQIRNFWSWNEFDVATYGLVYKTKNLEPGKTAEYCINLTLIPTLKMVSDVDTQNGIAGYLEASAKKGVIRAKGDIFKFTRDKFKDVDVTITLLDPSGNVAQLLKEQKVPAIFPEEMFSTEVQAKLTNTIPGGHYIISLQISDRDKDILYSTKRIVDLGKINIPKKSKELKAVMMWQLHQPIFSDIIKTKENLKNNIDIYRELIRIYKKHPKMKADIAISGALLYQLAQFYPDIIEDIKALVQKKQFNIIGTAFAMPLFPFVSSDQINYQIQVDKKIKKFLLGVEPQGGQMPEMAFKDGFFDALFKNNIRWIYFAQGPLEKGYEGIPDLDYEQPSKLISTGYPMNILIRDNTFVDLMRSDFVYKTDRIIQYLLQKAARNDGKKVLVFADKVENHKDLKFLDNLFSRIEKIKWVKILNGREVFKTYEPTQTFLGEKITGDWNTDPYEKKEPFAKYFEKKEQIQLWTDLSNTEAQVLGVNDKIKKAEDFGVDVSYPRSLFNEVWQNLFISAQSDWFISDDSDKLLEAGKNLSIVNEKTSEVYDNLMKILKDEELSIPLVSEVGAPLEDVLKDALFTKIPSDQFEIKDVILNPKQPTPVSAVNLYFTIYDKKNGIDYNNVYVVYHINDTDKYFRTKAKFIFDGRMKAFLGKTKAGFKVEYFIYAKDTKNNPSVSSAYTYEILKNNEKE